jgi:CheY-like chemotaxis protein
MMRRARANKPDDYLGGTTTIASLLNAIDLGKSEVLFSGRNARAAIAFPFFRPLPVLGGGGARSVRASSTGLTVLVVEDDWLVREDIVLGLQQEGWMVREAATGAAALRALGEAKIVDLLITDIGLGDAVTGWDVAEAFRVSRPIAPVIYVSGNPNNDARQVVGSVFLSKPVVISWLLATCRTLVKEINGNSAPAC